MLELSLLVLLKDCKQHFIKNLLPPFVYIYIYFLLLKSKLSSYAHTHTKKESIYSMNICGFTFRCIEHICLLLANYPQDEVRKVAAKLDLPNRDRKDSQGICFLGKVCPGRVHYFSI